MNFKSDDGNNPTDDTKDNGVYMDVLNAKHYFGKDVALTLGRYANNFGNQAGWRFGDSHDFDGAELAYNNGKLNVAAGFGQFDTNYNKKADNAPVGDEDAFYARAGYDFNVAKLGVDYVKFQEGSKYTVDPKQGKTFKGDDELLGVDLLVPFGGHQRWNVQGEYVKNTTTDLDKDDAWNAGLQYSNFNWKKPGSFALGVWYNDVGDATYFGGTGLQTNVIDAFFNKDGNGNYATNVKYWNLMGDVALQKNVSLHAEYAFGADADGAEDPDDAWTVSLNYKF